jgi:pyruvate,water dikinase
VSIYSGRRALEKAKQELRQDTLGKRQEIKGVIGSGGIARGPVKVVFTNKDLYKVKTGDVLVATMTRQDFVSVMRHVAAVVTDEGSVTAHAAIITREIGIPCIVATKIGTKILKDGDWVEVDANKGVVKILKRK